MAHNESTPSLVGANVRNVTDHDEYDKGQSSPTKSQPVPVHHDDAHKEYTSVNELADEGALINDEQEYTDLLDATGKVMPNVNKPSAVISGIQDDKLSKASKEKLIENAVPQPVQIDESHKDFVVVDIPHHPSVDVADAATPGESSGTPSIYELKNTDSGMSLEDLIDSQMASMTSLSSDLQKKLNKRKSAVPAANPSRSASRLRNVVETAIPDSVIENDAMQQVPAGLREGFASPLVQSRSQSAVRSTGAGKAAPEKPHLARGDSYSGVQTYESRPGRRADRGDGYISNLASKEYLRSVSRSRSRMGKETTLSSQDLTEEGALVTDDLDHDPEMIHKLDETLEEAEEDEESKATATSEKSTEEKPIESKAEDKSVDFSEEDSLDAITKKLEDVLREASPVKKTPQSTKIENPVEEVEKEAKEADEVNAVDAVPEIAAPEVEAVEAVEDGVQKDAPEDVSEAAEEDVTTGTPSVLEEEVHDDIVEEEHDEPSTLSETIAGVAAATGITAATAAIVSAVKGDGKEGEMEGKESSEETESKDIETEVLDKEDAEVSEVESASQDGITEPPVTEVDSPAEPELEKELANVDEKLDEQLEDKEEDKEDDSTEVDTSSQADEVDVESTEEAPVVTAKEEDDETVYDEKVPDLPEADTVAKEEDKTTGEESDKPAEDVLSSESTDVSDGNDVVASEDIEEASTEAEKMSEDTTEKSVVPEQVSAADDSEVDVVTDGTKKLSITSPVADETERLINELEAEIGGLSGDTSTRDITEGDLDQEQEEAEGPVIEASKDVEEEEKEVDISKDEPVVEQEDQEQPEVKTLETKESEPSVTAVDEVEEEEMHEPTKEEIIEMLKDEPVYLFTSLAGGGFLMPQRTNRLATILTANQVPFTYRDLGTDEQARNVWRRYGKGRVPPGIVRGKDDIIGNWEEIEEANEDYRVRELIYETL